MRVSVEDCYFQAFNRSNLKPVASHDVVLEAIFLLPIVLSLSSTFAPRICLEMKTLALAISSLCHKWKTLSLSSTIRTQEPPKIFDLRNYFRLIDQTEQSFQLSTYCWRWIRFLSQSIKSQEHPVSWYHIRYLEVPVLAPASKSPWHTGMSLPVKLIAAGTDSLWYISISKMRTYRCLLNQRPILHLCPPWEREGLT